MRPLNDVRLAALRHGLFTGLLLFTFAVRASYDITYTDLNNNSTSGSVSYTSGTQQVGYSSSTNFQYAAIWSGPTHSVTNLSPKGALGSYASGGAEGQQVGTVWFDSYLDHPVYAAVWNGSAASFRNLAPPGALYSEAFGTSGTQQVGEAYFTSPQYHTAPALWSGTAESFIDLSPLGYSGVAWDVAAGQQAGFIVILGVSHAAIWSGTAASFRDLQPPGAMTSEIFATTGTQQAGWASFGDPGRAGFWSGTAESFVSLHPAGAQWSQARATIGTAQGGFAVFTNNFRHAIIWFGSGTQFIDLHAFLPAEIYNQSQVESLWSDGTNIIAGGLAYAQGYVRPIVWTLTHHTCPITCPTNIFVCNDPGQCGAAVHFDLPSPTNCDGLAITCIPPSDSFFPTGTNTVQCVVTNSTGTITDSCSFEIIVRDCEPPVIQKVVATPKALWPPNHKMQPVTISVSATDNCHVASTKIISVVSGQSGSRTNGPNADWQITGDLTLNLRAERSSKGVGRTYSITVECLDDSGNSSTAVTHVETRPIAHPGRNSDKN